MPRLYTRRFDWDEAKRRHAAGESYSALAREFGVSEAAVWLAVNDDARALQYKKRREWQRGGVCPDCGGPSTKYGGSAPDTRCVRCSAIARSTTARPDELCCSRCKEWKPDEDFPHNRNEKFGRRGRHGTCRACSTVTRREHRQRNREAERAYDRAYKKRRRASEKK